MGQEGRRRLFFGYNVIVFLGKFFVSIFGPDGFVHTKFRKDLGHGFAFLLPVLVGVIRALKGNDKSAIFIKVRFDFVHEGGLFHFFT